MNAEVNTVRILGIAQVMVIVLFLISEQLLVSVVKSGSMSDILVNISKNLNQVRISNLVALSHILAIITMGVLYYVVLYKEYQIFALMALGCFLIAAVISTVGKIGISSLLPLSQEFVEAGAPASSHYQTLGDFLYYSVDRRGNELYQLFVSLGFLFANYVLFRGEYIPRWIAIWGLAAIILLLIPTVSLLYDREFLPAMQMLAIPYVPY